MVRLSSLTLTLNSVLLPLFSDEHKSPQQCVSMSSFVIRFKGPPDTNFHSLRIVKKKEELERVQEAKNKVVSENFRL